MNILHRAIARYGVVAQVCMAMEEFGELISQLNRFFFRNRGTRDDLASEVADAEIMLAQIRICAGDGFSELVDEIKQQKLERLEQRLAN